MFSGGPALGSIRIPGPKGSGGAGGSTAAAPSADRSDASVTVDRSIAGGPLPPFTGADGSTAYGDGAFPFFVPGVCVGIAPLVWTQACGYAGVWLPGSVVRCRGDSFCASLVLRCPIRP